MDIYCRACKEHREIVKFDRDDPVLSCGHIKHRTRVDDKIHDVQRDIEEMFVEEARKSNLTPEEIRTECVQGLLEIFGETEQEAPTVDHCRTCGTVTVIEKKGVRRCGGNMIDNPGCGMPIGEQRSAKVI